MKIKIYSQPQVIENQEANLTYNPDISEYMRQRVESFNRNLGITDALREGAAEFLSSLVPDNLMKADQIQSLVGNNNARLNDPIGREMSQEQFDTAMTEEAERYRRNNFLGLKDLSEWVRPEPHADPKTWYGNIAYQAAKFVPNMAGYTAEFAINPLLAFGLNTGLATQNEQNQVYTNLINQGLSPEEARERTRNLDWADLALRGGVNLATMAALRRPSAGLSPIGSYLDNLITASAIQGAGTMQQQELSNYRSGIENNPDEIMRAGQQSALATGAIGLALGALNARKLLDEQRRYNYFKRGIDIDYTDITPDDNMLGNGSNPTNPKNNPPQNNGSGSLALQQGTLQLPEYGNSPASRLARYNNVISKYGLTPISNSFQPNASFREIAAAIQSGKILYSDAVRILEEAGINHKNAVSFIDQANNEINIPNNETVTPPPERKNQEISFKPEWDDPLRLRPKITENQEQTQNNSPDNMPNLALGYDHGVQDILRLAKQRAERQPETRNLTPEIQKPDTAHGHISLSRPQTFSGVPDINTQTTKLPADSEVLQPPQKKREQNTLAPSNNEQGSKQDTQVQTTVNTPFFISSGMKNYKVVPDSKGRLEVIEEVKIGNKRFYGMTQGLFFYGGRLHWLDAYGNDTYLRPAQLKLEQDIINYLNNSKNIQHNNNVLGSLNPNQTTPAAQVNVPAEPASNKAATTSRRVIPEGAKLKGGTIDINGLKYTTGVMKGHLPTSDEIRYTVKPAKRRKSYPASSNETHDVLEIQSGLGPLFIYDPEDDTFFHDGYSSTGEDLKPLVEQRFREHINDFYKTPGKARETQGTQKTPTVNTLGGLVPDNSTRERIITEGANRNISAPHVKLAESIKSRVLDILRNDGKQINPISNNELLSIANDAFGGTKGEGKFDPRDAYDAMEMGINMAIQEAGIDPSKPDDTMGIVEDIQKLLRILKSIPTQTNRTDEQIKFQQFSTPPTLAYLVNWLANVQKGNSVLEPSAGTGNIAVFAHNSGANLLMNEISKRRAEILDYFKWGDVYREDALYLADILIPELDKKDKFTRPDRVIMNPPFSAAGKQGTANSNMIGQQHVIQALKLLKDGGRLVAILGGGREGNSTPHDKWLKHLGKKYNVNAVISIGGKAYSKYGTNFGNVIVVIDKTGATPENGTIRLKFSGDFNSFQDVSELFDTLADVRNNIQEGKTTKFSASKFVENNQLPERKTDIMPRTRENTAAKTVERIATVGEFHKTFDLLDNGRIFVRICDLRRNLGWPRDVFDKMLRDLRDNDVIQLHTGDASLMTPDEVADCFIDENGFRKGSITWLDKHVNVNLSQFDIPYRSSSTANSPEETPDNDIDPDIRNILSSLAQGKNSDTLFPMPDLISELKKYGLSDKETSNTINSLNDKGIIRVLLNPKLTENDSLDSPNAMVFRIIDKNLFHDTKRSEKSSEKKTAETPEQPQPKVKISNKTSQQITEERKNEQKTEKTSRKNEKLDHDEAILSSYSPTIVTEGAKHHPADLVESTALRAVKLPAVKQVPQIPQHIISQGKLSDAQMEAISLAVESFSHTLENGVTRGFFIGDGTGVGKGREISGIIMDTLSRGLGNGKALWISDKHSLIEDAKRDWQGIGNNPDDIFAQEKLSAKDEIKNSKGIIFTAYSHMASKDRIEQLKKWLGDNWNGIIVLDECHNVNNVLGDHAATRAINTRDFVAAFPKARVLYVSATGATELDNFAMLDRLGIWGYQGAPFNSAKEFVEALSQGGISAMEVAARDLKAMGLFVSRSLSMRAGPNGGNENVTFRTLEHNLNFDEKEVYDVLAQAWQKVEQNMEAAMKAAGYNPDDNKSRGRAKSIFWGAHQRFFNQIITSMQTDEAIRDMKKQLEAGNSVIVQLTNTQEAALNKAIAKGQNEDGQYDLSPKDTLIDFIRSSFSVQKVEIVKEDGKEIVKPVFASDGSPVVSQEALKIREDTINLIKSIKRFPDSPIDKILRFFGYDNVAEITGRSKRPRLDKQGSPIEKRNEKMRAGEIEDFNSGKRRILIFSEKGGTGASYHASNDFKNKSKRIHYLLQAGWRADKAIQGLGRSHRSNEAHKPEYVLVTTDIPGQKRFISSIARRLEQLGALSSGERKAASNGLFSEKDNLESRYAENALHNFFKYLTEITGSRVPKYPELNPKNVLEELGFADEKLENIDIPHFLNRMLAMTVDNQKLVFNRFVQEINAIKEQCEANGIVLDAPTSNIHAINLSILQDKNILHSNIFGTDSNYLQLEMEQPLMPLTWQDILDLKKERGGIEFYTLGPDKIIAAYKSANMGFDVSTSQFYEEFVLVQPDSRKKEYGVRASVLDNENPNQKRKFTRIDEKTAKALWQTQVDALPKTFKVTQNLITGAMLPIWKMFSGYPKIWRVISDDGREFLGRQIPDRELQRVLSALNVKYDSQKQYNAENLKNELSKAGMIANLLDGAKLKFSRVNGEKRLEIIPIDTWQEHSLVRNGLIREYISHKSRIFFPSGNDDILNNYLENNPVINVAEMDVADAILDEAAEIINSSIPDSSKLYFIHPSFQDWGASPAYGNENPYEKTSKYSFSIPEVEEEWQKSKDSGDNKKSIAQHFKDFAHMAWKGRHDFPELASDDYLTYAQELLRGLKRERMANLHEAEKRLRAIVLNLNSDDFELFEKASQLLDLNETRELDPNAHMPWKLDTPHDEDIDRLETEFNRFMDFLKENKKASDAVHKAEVLGNDLTEKLIKKAERLQMFDMRDRLKRRHYYRHIVLDYWEMQRSGQPRPTLKNPEKRGYLKHREGSTKNISSNWLLSMGEVFMRMTDDCKILDTLFKLRQEYDIIEKLKQDAFTTNKNNALQKILSELQDLPDDLRDQKANEALDKKLVGRQAKALSKLFRLAKDGDLPVGDDNEWYRLAGKMADAGQLENLSKEEQKELSRYIGWLAGLDAKSKARTYARTFIKSNLGKNSALKKILGDDFVKWQDLIPDDHTLWSPSDSRLVFSASTVPEEILKIAMEGIDELTGVPISEIGNAMNSGGNKQIWCIPKKLADTLNTIGTQKPLGSFGQFNRKLMNTFKRWAIHAPVKGRIWFYNWRNFFGDLEAVLQGNPGALYYLHQAAKELADTMLKGGEAVGMLDEFNKRGGGLTTEMMSELEHPEELQKFSHLFDQKKHIPIRKWPVEAFKIYFDVAGRLSNYREAVLRYASFLSYVKLIQDNQGKAPFYGMSKPNEVEVLKDNIYDMAFKLSNENLGAYDQLSQNMTWLRNNNFMSFISWVEVNFTRSIQMYKNIWSGNSYLEYWVKKYGQNFIDKTTGGNGGNNKPPSDNTDSNIFDDGDDNPLHKMFKNAAKKSPLFALRLAITMATAAPLFLILSIFNKLMGEDEKDLTPDLKNSAHLYLGKNTATGEIRYLSNLGSAFDFFETIGMGSIQKDLKDLFNGRTSFGQIALDIIDGPVSKIANNANPYAKAIVEMLAKRKYFPSVFNSSPIRDRAKYLAQSLNLDWYYDALTGSPVKPFSDMVSNVVNTQQIDQSAYFYILSRKREFQENVLGSYNDGFTQTRRGEALYNARNAAQLGKMSFVRKFMREYYREGGSDEGLQTSLRAMSPLYGLNKEQEAQFIKWLPKDERKTFRRAMRYYERIKSTLD